MYSIHKKLDDFKKWVNVDIRDEDIKNKVNNMIDQDYEKDSPKILEDIKGKYSPYKKHLSSLGRTHADLINTDHRLGQTLYVSLAAAKFKSKLKGKLGNNLNNTIK